MINFAIIHTNTKINVHDTIVSFLPNVEDIHIYIYVPESHMSEGDGRITYRAIPNNIIDSSSKIKNYVLQNCIAMGLTRYVHVLEDTIALNCNPMMFVLDVQQLMNKFNLSTWFSTTCDKMNFIYAKYNPRLNIVIDVDKYNDIGLKRVLFTSHANTQWVCYDMETADKSNMFFNETFTIPMFYIIEFLARRRNTSPETALNFMNMYPTVESEYGIFKLINAANQPEFPQEKMNEENAAFKSMNINYSPTNNIDLVLEKMYNILESK